MNQQTNTAQNFTELRKYIGNSSFPTTKVLGKDNINDGSGGIFYYDSTSTAPDDNENVIQPVSVAIGRWIKLIIDLPPISIPNLQSVTDKGNSTTNSINVSANPAPLGISQAPTGLNLYANTLIAGGSGNQNLNYNSYGDGLHVFKKRGTFFGGPVADFQSGPVRGLPAENPDEFTPLQQVKDEISIIEQYTNFTGTVAQIRALNNKDYKTFTTTDYGTGSWYLDVSDTTSPDNTGTILVTANGSRIKRIIEGPFINVLWFGAVPDYNRTTNTGTDNTSSIQVAIDYVDDIGGKSIYFPSGLYYVEYTLYINKEVGVPITLKGDGEIVKDRQNDRRGAVLFRETPGDIIRVNLKEDGTPFDTANSYQLNVCFDGLSFESATSLGVIGIKCYRTRGVFKNIHSKFLYATIYQDNIAPVGYVGWANYCDQSIYDNIRIFNAREYGLYLTHNDAGYIGKVYYEYPLEQAIYGIRLHESYGWHIECLLHSNANHLITPKANSAFVKIDRAGGFKINSIHCEFNEFESIVNMNNSYGGTIESIHERYGRNPSELVSNNLIKLSLCKGLYIGSGYIWAYPRAAGYYDIVDDLSAPNLMATDVTFGRLHIRNYLTDAIRTVTSNRTFDGEFGFYKNFQAVLEAIYDKSLAVVFNYANTPNFTTTVVQNLILPEITQNSTVGLPASADNVGRTIVLFNKNVSAFTTTVVGSLRRQNGTTTSLIPAGSATVIKSFIDPISGVAGWNIVSQYVDLYLPSSIFQIRQGTSANTFLTPQGFESYKPVRNSSTAATISKADLNAAYPTNSTTSVGVFRYTVYYPNLSGGAKVAIKQDDSPTGDWLIINATLAT